MRLFCIRRLELKKKFAWLWGEEAKNYSVRKMLIEQDTGTYIINEAFWYKIFGRIKNHSTRESGLNIDSEISVYWQCKISLLSKEEMIRPSLYRQGFFG